MPNHVINEVLIPCPTEQRASEIMTACINAEGEVDFSILLPIPLNAWMGSVGARHEQAFKLTGLEWARDNWGTKWNAYQSDRALVMEGGGYTVRLRFQTAWRPPYGWLCALFNHFKLTFEHRWLDEGDERAWCGRFDHTAMADFFAEPWRETEGDAELLAHLSRLLWGDAADEIMAERIDAKAEPAQ